MCWYIYIYLNDIETWLYVYMHVCLQYVRLKTEWEKKKSEKEKVWEMSCFMSKTSYFFIEYSFGKMFKLKSETSGNVVTIRYQEKVKY